MAPRETDHVGNQAMFVAQRQIGFLIDRRMAMPAEGFQGFLHKFARLCLSKVSLRIMQVDQFQAARRKDVAPGEDLRRPFAQRNVFNQLQAQQRGKNAKRITAERRIVCRTKRRRVDGHARLGEIVIADRIHAHNGEDPAQGGKLLRGANADRTVTFNIQARQFVCVCQLFM